MDVREMVSGMSMKRKCADKYHCLLLLIMISYEKKYTYIVKTYDLIHSIIPCVIEKLCETV